jgi:hypothetical protein
VLQLCAHRLVTQLLSLRPEYVTDGLSLIQFILASTFVYLQVSGLFHLVVGMLLLFGFNLPETNQRYFLASSFTDYWRRVNIYWKNFIMKVVYYPLYFRIKGWGATTALVVATLWAFFVTWALHLYQTWWLKGHLGFSWSDVLFWSILAALVLLNSLWEMKRGRQRKLASGYSLRGALGLALRTAGTFACISLLWSLWSTPTITQWIGLLRHADGQTLLWGLATLAGIMIATAIFEVLPANRKSKPTTPVQPTSPILRMVRPVAIGAAPLLLLLLVQQPAFQNRFDSLSAQVWYDVLNTGDSTAMMDQQVSEGGYYARLTSVDRADRALWETVMVTRLPDIPVGPATASRPVRDYRFEAAIVNVKTQAYDTMFETNPQGMRDRNYAFEKPTGTVRIALLGSSHTMGYGVRLEETFDSVLEERLNAQPPPGAEGVKFEVLNFAFSRLSPLSQISVIRTEAARFQPDIVVLVAQTEDDNWVTYDLARCLRERLPLPYEFPLRIMKEARVTAHTERNLAHRRLIPHRPELLGWSYERIVDECRRIDALPAAFFVPVPNDVIYNGLTNVMVQTNLMARAGFVTGDLSGLYDGLDPTEFMLSDAFHHCNARGHRLMADALYNAFVTDTNINLAHLSRKALGGLSGTPHLSRRTDRTDTNTN